MLRGTIVITDTSLSGDFDKIKQFCDKNDVRIGQLVWSWQNQNGCIS